MSWAWKTLSRLAAGLLFLSIQACQSLPASTQPSPVPSASRTQSEIPTQTDNRPSPSQTSVVAFEAAEGQSRAPGKLPTPATDPLRFVFPTPGREPVSAWRPPLYPTPWALTPYDHFYFARPIAADEINWPLADYRYGGVFLPDVVHTGIDIPAPMGTPVLAAGSGRVTWAGFGLYRGVEDPTDPYGLAVAIKHDFGHKGDTLYTVYGHLDRVDVVRGQNVQAGDALGLVGQTGQVTGPHLHFEVRIGRNNYFVSRNPELWLAPPQGWGVLAARVMNTAGGLLHGQLVIVHSQDNNREWSVKSYGQGTVNSDPYYQENVVLGDLPAGDYEIWISFEGSTYDSELTIKPGLVSYFTFRGRNGFKTDPPPTPDGEFTPPPVTLSPTP
jgi:murein DD-endopeptidase MepM/ murein hydrolase activator NlpD